MSTSSGFLLIDKPTGPTSHDIIYELRRITEIKKIGHAGTLDPFASGLLIVGIGREATRQLNRFLKLDKEYIATLKLGLTSDTYDREGNITASSFAQAATDTQEHKSIKAISKEEVKKVLQQFTGEIAQVPPMYSAKKVKGKKLYELARRGIEVERKPAVVTIHELRIMEYEWPLLKLFCKVSSGTYIRSLAHDIGQALGCGAYLEELERVAIGQYNIKDAVSMCDLTSENIWDYIRELRKT